MVQVQVRMPDAVVEGIDTWVDAGRFKSRSDAVNTIVVLYEEVEKTRKFLEMLQERGSEMDAHPEEMKDIEELLCDIKSSSTPRQRKH